MRECIYITKSHASINIILPSIVYMCFECNIEMTKYFTILCHGHLLVSFNFNLDIRKVVFTKLAVHFVLSFVLIQRLLLSVEVDLVLGRFSSNRDFNRTELFRKKYPLPSRSLITLHILYLLRYFRLYMLLAVFIV